MAQHDQTTMTLDDMYQVATDTQRESGLKASKPVSAIQDDSQSEDDEDEEDAEDEVVAFQNKRNNRFQGRNRNQGSRQRSNRSNTGSGKNCNRNGKYCFYCKIQNHTQEECRKRMKDNKPYKDKQGRAYWPEVFVTSDNQERDPQGQQPVFH